jgi:dihydroorotase
MTTLLLQQVTVLRDATDVASPDDVLLDGDRLVAWGEEARRRAEALGIAGRIARGCLLAPLLVDPHSVLERPLDGVEETAASLRRSAAAAGYGQVALLPRSVAWRDDPERWPSLPDHPLRLRFWGSFSRGGAGRDLAPHASQLQVGAVGLAEDRELPDLALLDRGLELGEMGPAPVLLPARLAALTCGGFVRESPEALRAGWPTDPAASELLPLQSVLALAALHPERRLAVMNLSTAAGVRRLESCRGGVMATVSWWSLLRDSGGLAPTDEGWKIVPSLGGPADREALLAALERGVITAVAVQHEPLDAEEQSLPLDQRRPGVAGHRFVLPTLWQELVVRRGWTPQQLWRVLSWGASDLLALDRERLVAGSNRWLLFDPGRTWIPMPGEVDAPAAANQPLIGQPLQGRVLGSGPAGGVRILPSEDPR